MAPQSFWKTNGNEYSNYIISGVLGHSNIDTTAEYYISSNLKQLRECSLEVLFDLPGNIQAEVEEDKQDEL